jgi:hypothetical protein
MRPTHFESGTSLSLPTKSLKIEAELMDATYNLSGGFKPRIKRFADLDGPDFFQTPAWATYALIDNEKFSGEIWESACGDGALSRVLAKTGCSISSSDLHDRGYGDVGIDFLTAKRQAENIVTRLTTALRASSRPASKKRNGTLRFSLGWHFLKAPIERTRSSLATRRAAFGYSASGSHSIRPAPSRKVRERPLTLGSLGIKTRADLN